MNQAEEFSLDDTHVPCLLRSDSGDQAGFGVRQHIVPRTAVGNEGFSNHIEIPIGTDAGELGSAVPTRIRAPSFIIVPIKAGSHLGSQSNKSLRS